MKEFLVYTGLRLGLLVASFATVAGIWLIATGGDLPILPPLIISFIVSGVASWYLLEHQRVAFAHRVEARAGRTAKAFEEMRAAEDAGEDEPPAGRRPRKRDSGPGTGPDTGA